MPEINFESFKKLWDQLDIQQRRIVGVGSLSILTFLVAALGLTAFSLTRENKSPIQIQKSSDSQVLSAATLQNQPTRTPSVIKKIMVDIAGAVNSPGVYELEEGSRVKDVIEKAGGLSSKANLEYLSKYINQAHIVSEAEKIYIPKQGEDLPASGPAVGTSSAASAFSAKKQRTQVVYPVNLNTASQTALESLPGIGPTYAKRIIKGRPYAKIAEVMKVKGIGEKTFQKIKELITVN